LVKFSHLISFPGANIPQIQPTPPGTNIAPESMASIWNQHGGMPARRSIQMNLHEGDVKEPSSIDRRAFCADLLLTSTALMLAASNVTKAKAGQDSMVVYPPRKIEGAELLLPGTSLYFNYPTMNDPAVLLRLNESEYRAYSRRCSHAGCSVEVDRQSRCLTCPCHRGSYDARLGHVMFGPPKRPLDEIVLDMRAGGHIWAIGKSIRNTEIIT
jgi:Rieske Fe-S protein